MVFSKDQKIAINKWRPNGKRAYILYSRKREMLFRKGWSGENQEEVARKP
ncbi:hypothetical protein LguiA_017235 [Lonicera macranthoides]